MYDQQIYQADIIRRLAAGTRRRMVVGAPPVGEPVPLTSLFGETTVRYWRGW